MTALQGSQGAVGKSFDMLASWREWADDVRGGAVESGHYIPEEAPQAVVEAIAETVE